MSSLRTIIRSGRWCAYCRQPPRISITPSVVRPKEVPLPDQLQDTSKDESLCCFVIVTSFLVIVYCPLSIAIFLCRLQFFCIFFVQSNVQRKIPGRGTNSAKRCPLQRIGRHTLGLPTSGGGRPTHSFKTMASFRHFSLTNSILRSRKNRASFDLMQ